MFNEMLNNFTRNELLAVIEDKEVFPLFTREEQKQFINKEQQLKG